MDVPSIGPRAPIPGFGSMNALPVNATAAASKRPDFEEATEAQAQADHAAETAPHAAPAQRVVTHSQQSISEAVRELKLAETPLNLAIAEALTQYDQAISTKNITVVRDALRGMPNPGADDVAAAIILLMNDLPVTKAGIAAIRQLMTGKPLGEQMATLENQLNRLAFQVAAAETQLAALPQDPATPPANPATGTPLNVNPLLTPPPGTIVPQGALAASLANEARKALPVGDDLIGFDGVDGEGEGSEEDVTAEGPPSTKSAAGAGISAPTQRRTDHGPINRSLGGGVGSLGDQAPVTKAIGQGAGSLDAAADGEAAPQPDPGALSESANTSPSVRLTPAGARPAPDSPSPHQDGQPGHGHQPGSGTPGQGRAPSPALSAGLPAPKPDSPTAPSAPPTALAGSGPGTSPRSGAASYTPPGGVITPQTAPPPSVGTLAAQGRGGPGPVLPGSPPPDGIPAEAPATGPMAPTATNLLEVRPLAPRLQALLHILKGTALATVVQEPAHLRQQVSALKALHGPLFEDLARVEKALRQHLAEASPSDHPALEEAHVLLSKLIGRRPPGQGGTAEEQQLLQTLADDIQETLLQAGKTARETVQHLQAREQLSNSNQVFCIPLAMLGPPRLAAEMLVERDPGERNGPGGSIPVRIRLALETHHLGAVGIDLTTWQQHLKVQLQVSDPRIQARMVLAQEKLEKALARFGYVGTDVSVAVVAKAPQNSLLLPERTFAKNLNRIEGVV